MEIPYTVTARPDTGLWNAKIGIWLFLASEVMLFGGLFSAYIFLRIDADYPWPVQVLNPWWGFINTLVLIFSSVTVLQAWIAVKMRKLAQCRMWLAITILCAMGFMVIKSVEYYDKFHHYGVRLQDGSMLEGHLPNGYNVKFGEVSNITLAGATAEGGTFTAAGLEKSLGLEFTIGGVGSDGNFLSYTPEGKVQVEDEKGEKFDLTPSKVRQLVKAARLNKVATINLKVLSPVVFSVPPTKFRDYTEGHALFRDGTALKGKVLEDKMMLSADKVDLRRLLDGKEKNVEHGIEAVANADAWRILGPEWKAKFVEHAEAQFKHFTSVHPGKKNLMENSDFTREVFVMPLNSGEHHVAHSKVQPSAAENKAEVGAHGAAAEAAHAGGHGHPDVTIPKKDIAFYSNFTPKFNTYFAIYFALTGLHGLHVLAGALVLGHFMLFGKKIYAKNPEHLANRVETGGLFWHFVDLVWIFLFPLLYLM